MQDKGMPEYYKVLDEINRVEKRTGISVRSYLAFGISNKQVQEKSYTNPKYIGEMNA